MMDRGGNQPRLPIIAIDGPAGAGKTTTAREIARRLSFLHLDTGAMYRAIALQVLRQGRSLTDPQEIAAVAFAARVALAHGDQGLRVTLDGEDVTDHLRSAEVTQAVTPVCEVPQVRERMVSLQRLLGENGGVVAEGRDIGTVVFPQAELKIFLVAELRERALRRQRELEAAGHPRPLGEVLEDIRRRDLRDEGRSHSPLRRASDAILLDTTHLSFAEQVAKILQLYSDLVATA